MIAGVLLLTLLQLAWPAKAAQVRTAGKESFPSDILLQKTAYLLRWQAYWGGHGFISATDMRR